MSREIENNNRRSKKEARKKLFVRIMALLLAILMVGGMAYYTIYLLTTTISADSEITETVPVDTSSLSANEDVLVRVGLTYGSNVTVGFETTTTDGYILGITDSSDDSFTPIWELDKTKVAVTTDANLSKSNMTYSIASSAKSATVGGFHIQVDCDKYTRDEYEEIYNNALTTFGYEGLPVIPAYVYTGYTLRIGAFTTWDQAEAYLDTVNSIYPNEVVYVTGPSKTSVSVIDPNTDEIYFEYDCGSESTLGMRGKEDRNGNTYIKTPAANVYDGVFTFMRHNNGTVDGVSLINIVPLEAYIAGVLPYEMSPSWPLEALKAFAITVRSYTLTHLTRHSTNSFGLCNNAHCQVYKGAGRINENVLRAVMETAEQVMTYNNEIVTAYYSSSMGGVTVSAKDAWGSKDIPYLKAIPTPWEDYANHDNGFWITEITPQNLAARLNQAGYTEIKKAVASVEIVKFAKNSTYINQLRVKDIYGNSVLLDTCEEVRTSLTPYVKSANFVIGKGSVEYTENIVSNGLPGNSSSSQGGNNNEEWLEPGAYDKDFGYINLFDYHVLTYQDEYVTDIEDNVTVLTGNGDVTYERRDIFVISSANASAFTGEVPEINEEEEDSEDSYVTETIPDKSTDAVKYKIAYAENPENFIIVGKGWGHGVGISQYGAYDLALLGYSAEDILSAYFNGIEIVRYTRLN